VVATWIQMQGREQSLLIEEVTIWSTLGTKTMVRQTVHKAL